jgi:hypothetical protein
MGGQEKRSLALSRTLRAHMVTTLRLSYDRGSETERCQFLRHDLTACIDALLPVGTAVHIHEALYQRQHFLLPGQKVATDCFHFAPDFAFVPHLC